MATIFSILIAITLWFLEPNLVGLAYFSVTAGSVMLLAGVLARVIGFVSLQRAEENVTPRVMELISKDSCLQFSQLYLFVFVLFSFVLAGLGTEAKFLFPVWVVAFGVALDTLYLLIKKQFRYLTPAFVVTFFSKAANRATKKHDFEQLRLWVDALAGVAMQACQRSSTSLLNRALKEMETVSCDYAKSFSRLNIGEEKESVYFAISYFLHLFASLHARLMQEKLEFFSIQIIITMGKLVVFLARLDSELARLPVHYLGEFTREAQSRDLNEVSAKAVIVLKEVSKNIIEDSESSKLQIKELMLRLIQNLEEIGKTAFRRDKTTNISLLKEPFYDLKEFLMTEKYGTHPETADIIGDLDRVLGEFESLELVLRSVPNIPGYSDKTSH